MKMNLECNKHYNDKLIINFFQQYLHILKAEQLRNIIKVEKSLSICSCPIYTGQSSPHSCECAAYSCTPHDIQASLRLTQSNPELPTPQMSSIGSIREKRSIQSSAINTYNFLSTIRDNVSTFRNLCLNVKQSIESKFYSGNKPTSKSVLPPLLPSNICLGQEVDSVKNLQRMSGLSEDLLNKFNRLRNNIHIYNIISNQTSRVHADQERPKQTSENGSQIQKCVYRQIEQLTEIIYTLTEIFVAMKKFQECTYNLKNACKNDKPDRSLSALSKISSKICNNLERLHSNQHLLNYIQETLIDTKILMRDLVDKNSTKISSYCKCIDSKAPSVRSIQNEPIILKETPQKVKSSFKNEISGKKERYVAQDKYSQNFQTLFNMIREISQKIDSAWAPTMALLNAGKLRNLTPEGKETSNKENPVSKISVGIQYQISDLNFDPYYELIPKLKFETSENQKRAIKSFPRSPLPISKTNVDSKSEPKALQKLHFSHPDFFREMSSREFSRPATKHTASEKAICRRSLTPMHYAATSNPSVDKPIQHVNSEDIINVIHKLEDMLYLRKTKEGRKPNKYHEVKTQKMLSMIYNLKSYLFLEKKDDLTISEANSSNIMPRFSKGIQTNLGIKPQMKSCLTKRRDKKKGLRYRKGNIVSYKKVDEDHQLPYTIATMDPYTVPIQTRTPKDFENNYIPEITSQLIDSFSFQHDESKEWIVELILQPYKYKDSKTIRGLIDQFSKKFNINASKIRVFKKYASEQNRKVDKIPNIKLIVKQSKPIGSSKYQEENRLYKKLPSKKYTLPDSRKGYYSKKRTRDNRKTKRDVKSNEVPKMTAGKAPSNNQENDSYVSSILERFSPSSGEQLSIREIKVANKDELFKELEKRGKPSFILSKAISNNTLEKWMKERRCKSY